MERSTQTNSGSAAKEWERSQNSGARSQESELRTQNSKLFPTSVTPIIEATGWLVTPTGEVFLVASTPAPPVQNPLNQPVTCQGREYKLLKGKLTHGFSGTLLNGTGDE